jgi:hypothetical protein
MSVINLGLQCIGLAHQQMSSEFEKEVEKCNTLSELRKCLKGHESLVQNSLSPVKALLSSIFTCLKLHDEYVCIFCSACLDEISNFWSTLLILDSTLNMEGTFTKETIKKYLKVLKFIDHCCQESHYVFDILKCGESTCELCKPVRLPFEVFNKLRHIPHPIPGSYRHYLSFNEAFGQSTTEEHRPSINSSKSGIRRKLHFSASVQHVRNSQIMVQCLECGMWRLIFSKYKLKKEDCDTLTAIVEESIYTSGSM